MTNLDHARRPLPRHRRRTLAHGSWQRAGAVLVSGFLVWLVLDATVLQHNANVSPVGARRTAALDVLGPPAWLARALRLDAPVSGANEALGRDANGGFAIPTVPATTTGSTTTTLPPRIATRRHPLRVLIVGDSIGLDLAVPLQADLAATGAANATVDGMIDTGLTRLDYFNWIKRLKYDVYVDRPQLIVGMMGMNDPKAFVGPPSIPFGTTAWRAQYLRNAATLFSIARQGGRDVLWVGVPLIADKGVNANLQVVRDLQRHAAAAQHIAYYDSNDVLSPHGTFAAYLRVGGELAQVRTSDGLHLEPAGGQLLAVAVLRSIETDFHLHFQ